MSLEGIRTGKELTAVVGGSVDIGRGSICHYDQVNREATLAFDENQDLFYAIGSACVGKAITLVSVKTLNRTMFAKILEAGSIGANLYLDEQANLAAATGKLKVTAGNATRVIARLENTVSSANADDGVTAVIPESNFTIDNELFKEAMVGVVTTGGDDIFAGAIVVYTAATKGVTLAWDEAATMHVALNGGTDGDTIYFVSVDTLNKYFNLTVTEAAAVGDSLYLDLQANLAAATGKVKVTAGAATVVIMKANAIAAAADDVIECYSNSNLN